MCCVWGMMCVCVVCVFVLCVAYTVSGWERHEDVWGRLSMWGVVRMTVCGVWYVCVVRRYAWCGENKCVWCIWCGDRLCLCVMWRCVGYVWGVWCVWCGAVWGMCVVWSSVGYMWHVCYGRVWWKCVWCTCGAVMINVCGVAVCVV